MRLVIAVCVWLLWLSAGPARACKCAWFSGPVCSNVYSSKLLFTGKVIGFERSPIANYSLTMRERYNERGLDRDADQSEIDNLLTLQEWKEFAVHLAPPEARSRLEEATSITELKSILEEEVSPDREPSEEDNHQRVIFEVDEVFRGSASGTVKVFNPIGWAACEILFELGKSYLVNAYRNRNTGSLHTGRCARTKEISEAEADLRVIRRATGPQQISQLFIYTIAKPDLFGRRRPPVPGLEIQVSADGFDSTKTTDQTGTAQFDISAAGRYQITARRNEETVGTVEVQINPSSCTQHEFRLK
jgi:hypothetical protein